MFVGGQRRFFAAPASIESLAKLAAAHPDAVILAGATDVGLWITKQLKELPKIIHIARVDELHRVEDAPEMLTLGSAVTYAEAEPHLAAIDPDLGELLRRLGGKQVRAVGTIGGNIANGSPIGDTPPALIALGATIELRKGRSVRRLPLEDFFIAYGKQDRAPGEVLIRISIPKLRAGEAFRCYKETLRLDPANPEVCNNLGILLCDDLKDYGKAVECFRKAIALDPNYADAHSNLGVALGNLIARTG